MAAKRQVKIEPVNPFQLVGYTLLCWPQTHFYSANLIDILGEYNVSVFEAKNALSQLRRQGYLEYCHKPPGLWRIRETIKKIRVSPGHRQIFEALEIATKENIDARLASAPGAPKESAPETKQLEGVDYYHLAAAALQVWPCSHFDSRQLAAYCNQFLPTIPLEKSYRNRLALGKLKADGRLWQSPFQPRLHRITQRGRMASLGPHAAEILTALGKAPPQEAPPGKDYLLAYALVHFGEWAVGEAMAWIADKGAGMERSQVMDFLKRLENRRLVEQMKKGRGSFQPSIFRTRPALYEVAAPDLSLFEQLLHPEKIDFAWRCFPHGRPEDLQQIGKAAPDLTAAVTVATSGMPAKKEKATNGDKTPGQVRLLSLKGVVLENVPAPVQQLARGELSNVDIVAGLVDYIAELKIGSGVSEVARLRRGLDNLNGALQKTRGQLASKETTIKKLNAIKAQLEEQVKELSSQLAAANNRLQEAKNKSRPPVVTGRDKGSGFGLAEVATFRGRRLSIDQKPVITKKRASG